MKVFKVFEISIHRTTVHPTLLPSIAVDHGLSSSGGASFITIVMKPVPAIAQSSDVIEGDNKGAADQPHEKQVDREPDVPVHEGLGADVAANASNIATVPIPPSAGALGTNTIALDREHFDTRLEALLHERTEVDGLVPLIDEVFKDLRGEYTKFNDVIKEAGASFGGLSEASKQQFINMLSQRASSVLTSHFPSADPTEIIQGYAERTFRYFCLCEDSSGASTASGADAELTTTSAAGNDRIAALSKRGMAQSSKKRRTKPR